MDDKKATQDVIACLGAVADVLRAYSIPELEEAADRLESIAVRMAWLRGARARTSAGDRQSDLIADSLQMLETFREIDSPAVRRAAISMIRALRPEIDR